MPVRLGYLASVVCEFTDLETGRECTETAKLTRGIEETTPELFAAGATRYFRAAGWQCGEAAPNDKCLCPRHG